MKLSKRHLAVLALIIANIIWGAASPIFKWSLESIPPFTLAFIRFSLAALIILPFAPLQNIKLQDLAKIAIIAGFGITTNIAFFFLALQRTSSINAPIIGASGAIFLILISFFFFHQKPKKKVVFGTILSLAGVLLITVDPLLKRGYDGTLFGNLLLLLATICFAIYTILLKKLTLRYPPLMIVFWTFFLGALMFFPLSFLEIRTTTSMNLFSYQALVGIFYGAVFSSTLAYLCYDIGIKYLKTEEIGIFSYLGPIAAILVAMPLLGETVNPAYIVGALIVFAGIFIAEQKIHYHPLHFFPHKEK